MSRRKRYSDKELDELQKIKYENKKLKRQISSLRKQLQKIDIDRYENLKDLLYKQANENLEEKIKAQRKKFKERWECHKCRVGYMKPFPVIRQDGAFYYRKCSECNNRTKLKPYTKNVEGLDLDDK